MDEGNFFEVREMREAACKRVLALCESLGDAHLIEKTLMAMLARSLVKDTVLILNVLIPKVLPFATHGISQDQLCRILDMPEEKMESIGVDTGRSYADGREAMRALLALAGKV